MSPRAIGVLVVAWTAACSAACATQSQQVTLRDHGIIMPTFRFGIGLQGNDDAENRVGLTAELTRADGSPSSSSNYEMTSTQVLGRIRITDSPNARVFMLAGFEHLDFKAAENSGATPTRLSKGAFGLCPGLEVAVTLLDPLEVYARGTASAMLPPATSARAEVGLRCTPVDTLEFFAGYRWWDFDYESDDLYAADVVDINTEGLFLGMGLRL